LVIPRHVDFNPSGWREFVRPPAVWNAYAQQVQQWSPLSYWRLGETTGPTAVDQAGSLDAAYVGPVQHNQPGAIFRDTDGAARLNGTNASISVPDTGLLNNKNQCTILFWMKYHAPSVSKDGAIISRWPDPSNGGWIVWVDATGFLSGRKRTITFSSHTTAGLDGRVEGSTDLVTPGVWDFYALTFTGGDAVRLYKNGQLDRAEAASFPSLPSLSAPAWIGRSGGSIPHLPAELDEFALFDIALSADQIAALHDLGRGHLRLPATGGPS